MKIPSPRFIRFNMMVSGFCQMVHSNMSITSH
jgi:hypothetical protein